MVLARHLARNFAMPLAAHPGLIHRRWLPSKLDNLELWLAADSGVVTDGAVNFVAADKSRLTKTDSTLISTGNIDFSWCGWVQVNDATLTQTVLAKWDTVNNREFMLRCNGSRFVLNVSSTGSDSTTLTSSTVLANNTWYFVYFYHDSVNDVIGISVNGAAATTSAYTLGVYDSAASLEVGGRASVSEYLGGRLDSWLFCKSTLTSSEITWLYNGGAGRIMAEIAAHETLSAKATTGYDFDELSGTRYDYFGTNNLTEAFADIIAPGTLNGGFETLGAGGSDVFANWSEAVAGTSVVADETVNMRSGSHACRFNVDASGSAASIQQFALTSGKRYTSTVYARKGAADDATSFIVRFGGSSATSNTHTITSSYAAYTNTSVKAEGTAFYIRSGSDAASNTIYLDDVTLRAAEILSTQGIAAGQAVEGDTVYTWTDKSGNSRNAIQATVAKRPTYKANVLNGKPVLRFDGVDDWMQSTFGSTLAQPNTVFIVGKGTANSMFFDGLSVGARHYLYRTSQWIYYAGSTVTGGTANGNYHVFAARYNGASSYLYVDGALTLSGDTGSHSLAGLILGANYNQSVFCNGDIAEIGVYSDALTDSERKAVERYLSRKYGITLAS